jgi:hypothetical protein
MNWPIESKCIRFVNETAFDKVTAYMKAHADEFRGDDEQTHARAQSIVDALNANDPGKCIVEGDKELVENVDKFLQSMCALVDKKGYPNATIACGYDPGVVYMVSDTKRTARAQTMCLKWVPAKD